MQLIVKPKKCLVGMKMGLVAEMLMAVLSNQIVSKFGNKENPL